MMRQPRGSRWVVSVVVVALAAASLVAVRHGRSGMGMGRPDAILGTEHVAKVDAALAAGSIPAAVRAWHDAHATALASGWWEAMLESGHACLRIGRAAATREVQARARQAYLLAALPGPGPAVRRRGAAGGHIRRKPASIACSGHSTLPSPTPVSPSSA